MAYFDENPYKERLNAFGPTTTESPIVDRSSAPSAGGGATDQLSNIGMASGNPYAMGASAAFKVLGAAEKRYESEYQDRLKKLARQQGAMNNLITISQGLRNL